MTNQITLPRDAEGREIPLDTKVLYDADGNELRVKCVEFDPFDENWRFVLKADSSIWFDARYPRYLYLEKPTPPDSWEKLEQDATLLPHDYLTSKCPPDKRYGHEAMTAMSADLVCRAKKLAGVE